MAFGLEELARRPSVIDEADRPAVGGLELVLGVDAQLEVKDSRKVGRRHPALGRQIATGVGLAQDKARWYPRAGHEHAVGPSVMVAAGILAALRPPAEFASSITLGRRGHDTGPSAMRRPACRLGQEEALFRIEQRDPGRLPTR